MERIYTTFAKRNYIGNEMHVFGIVLGILIGICDDENSEVYDCELFDNFAMLNVKTSSLQYDKFRKKVESIYPGLCDFDERYDYD